MVPDFAKASLVVHLEHTEVVQRYIDFLKKTELEGKYYIDNGELILELQGVSAHGMEPDNGKNAGILMASFLASLQLDEKACHYFQFVSRYLCDDSRGRKLGIACADEITGDLTVNVGKLSYTKENGGRLGFNVRYPVTNNMDDTKNRLQSLIEDEHFRLENFTDSKPHHVEEDDFLIQTLKKVYEQQTGEKAELLAIGGGTYARSLKSGVAFGPLFPGREDVAHQKDEYVFIEDLIKAAAIYAQAIYELAK
jgi:succinyl-diaminopimelate desuccinylase